MARLLELALAVTVVIAPWPLGAVGPRGRFALEMVAFFLVLLWLARSWLHRTPLPSRPAMAGLAGLLLLAVLQIVPLGSAVVGIVSPNAARARAASSTPPELTVTEERMLGADPATFDPPARLSVDPGATASALRTGAAIVGLFLVATTVAATCGARRLALALLISAGFQGLYGLLTLASGHDRIWHLPKNHFLDCATGTFVNRNHYACLLSMSLACGAGLILHNAKRRRATPGQGIVGWFRADNVRNLLLGLLLLVGLAGLLLSFSRAGIALGLLAVGMTLLAAGGFQRFRFRAMVAAAVIAVAVVPLAVVGPERLVERYAASGEELAASRLIVWRDSLSLLPGFPLVGTGFGTFAAAYPLARSPEIRKFFSHTHSDPLQLLVEGGAVAGVCMALLLFSLLGLMVRSLASGKGTLAVGFAAGLVAMLLHSFVDFNFHIPSNAATAAVLAGVLEGLPWKRTDSV